MNSIQVGSAAPKTDASFPDYEGVEHSVAAALERGPVLLGIYKSSCGASKAMFPMMERIHKRYAADGLTVLGVAQDSPNITRSFARRYEITFPLLIEGDSYPVSSAWDIQATPTVFVIGRDGKVTYTTMGYLLDQVNEIGAAIAKELGKEPEIIVREDEDVPFFVPG